MAMKIPGRTDRFGYAVVRSDGADIDEYQGYFAADLETARSIAGEIVLQADDDDADLIICMLAPVDVVPFRRDHA